jgi:16S rRNA (uracil1498-N3)-methyltransferase
LQRIVITPHQIDDRQIVLTSAQHHYLNRVIRLQSGDRFHAIDGTGNLYLAVIKNNTAEIIELITSDDRELPLSTNLICALPKGSGFDDIVRASTELGVTTIFPAISDRTLLQPSPNKLARWRKIAAEAAEQSERTQIPHIAEPQSFSEILGDLTGGGNKYICEARGDHPHLLSCLNTAPPNLSAITIAIGPEGGWTDTELHRALDRGFQPVSLGRRVFRAITAPIVALSLIAGSCETKNRLTESNTNTPLTPSN